MKQKQKLLYLSAISGDILSPLTCCPLTCLNGNPGQPPYSVCKMRQNISLCFTQKGTPCYQDVPHTRYHLNSKPFPHSSRISLSIRCCCNVQPTSVPTAVSSGKWLVGLVDNRMDIFQPEAHRWFSPDWNVTLSPSVTLCNFSLRILFPFIAFILFPYHLCPDRMSRPNLLPDRAFCITLPKIGWFNAVK